MSTIQPSTHISADLILDEKLHPTAEESIIEYVGSFANTLVFQSKIQAYREQAEVVLSRHVKEALEHILYQRKRDWLREGLKIVGGALLGAFVPGLISSLPSGDTLMTYIYIGLGFVGMLMVFLGIGI